MKFVCQKKKKNERIHVEELYYYDSSVNSIGSKSRRKVAVERYMPRTIYRAASRLNVKGKVSFSISASGFSYISSFQFRQCFSTSTKDENGRSFEFQS